MNHVIAANLVIAGVGAFIFLQGATIVGAVVFTFGMIGVVMEHRDQ